MRILGIVGFVLLLGSGVAQATPLKIGDPAPSFSVTDWLKGDAHDLAAGKDKSIFVLEFWATWCMPCIQQIPHITEMQTRYGPSGVVVIGVTGPLRGQRLSDVKGFLQARGADIGYSVAWDQEGKTYDAYMNAVGAMGIPYVFIIDRQGRIAWHGNSSPYTDRVLDGLTAGTLDLAVAARWQQNEGVIQELLMRFNTTVRESVRTRDFGGPLGLLDQILDLDPAHDGAMETALTIHLTEIRDLSSARSWVDGYLKKHGSDTDGLVMLTSMLLGIDEPGMRMPDLVLASARAAVQASAKKSASALAAYARAAHYVGNLDEALRLQTEAIEAAPEGAKPEMTKAHDFYRACRELRESGF